MIRAAIATLSLLVVTTASHSTSPRAAAPDPEHARLAAMVGTWDVEMTLWPRPGGTGITVKATSTIRSILNGLFIEEKIEGAIAGTPFTTMAWTGYNSDSRQYEATRIATSNTARIAESGGFDAASGQFTLKADYPLGGDTWHQRTVIRQPSANAMTAESWLSFGTVSEWKGVEIKYTRRAN